MSGTKYNERNKSKGDGQYSNNRHRDILEVIGDMLPDKLKKVVEAKRKLRRKGDKDLVKE